MSDNPRIQNVLDVVSAIGANFNGLVELLRAGNPAAVYSALMGISRLPSLAQQLKTALADLDRESDLSIDGKHGTRMEMLPRSGDGMLRTLVSMLGTHPTFHHFHGAKPDGDPADAWELDLMFGAEGACFSGVPCHPWAWVYYPPGADHTPGDLRGKRVDGVYWQGPTAKLWFPQMLKPGTTFELASVLPSGG